eukprot:403352983
MLICSKYLPSNDCLNLIFMYKFDKKQAVYLPLRRLCKNANNFYSKDYVLSHFKKPKKKLVINHMSDHDNIARNLSQISNVYELQVSFNINLNTWRDKLYGFDKEKQKYTNNAYKVLTYFLTEYELNGFSLNYQLMLKNFDLLKSQQITPKSKNIQFIQIGCSELQMQSLIVLSQIPNLKKLIIHETIICHCQEDITTLKDQLQPNQSIEEFSFYKNQICIHAQKILFSTLLPYLTNLQKLKIPTNQFRDTIIDDILMFFKNQRHQNIRSLNIGNNLFQITGITKLMNYLTKEYFSIKKLELSFQQFEDAQSFKKVIDIIQQNKTIEVYNFEGCSLTLQDVEMLNNLLVRSKNNPIKQLRLGLNKFTDEQLTQRFRSDSISTIQSSSTDQSSQQQQFSDSESIVDEQGDIQMQQQQQSMQQQQVADFPIMDVIERPIESFQDALLKRMKMY